MMRSPIPLHIRQQLAEDSFMVQCFLFPGPDGDECEGRTEWQHAFKYVGKRQNELWAILPMCHKHHYQEARLSEEQIIVMRQRIAYFKAEDEFRAKYPKSNLLSAPVVKRGRRPNV